MIRYESPESVSSVEGFISNMAAAGAVSIIIWAVVRRNRPAVDSKLSR
jgi:hypothetical protein